MKRRRTRDKKNSGAPRWMVTYSDMVTLILVFFILLFSMSQIDLRKFETISESFKSRAILDFLPSMVPTEHPSESEGPEDPEETPKNVEEDIDDDEQMDSLDILLANVEQFLNEHQLNNVITATRTTRGVVLVLQEKVLFDVGDAIILESGKPFLKKIGTLLTEVPNNINVEGHTDNNPINNHIYPSNWELSGARASSVIRFLIDENDFNMERFSLIGYGETKPIRPNDSLGNMSKNRRVEIIILDEEFERPE